MNIAKATDINKYYSEAVNCYENSIASGNPDIDDFINLAVLYWLCARDYSFFSHNEISDELSLLGGDRYKDIITLGLSHYPDSLELHFWNIYCEYRSKTLEFTETDCKNLIVRFAQDKTLIPYFFLQLFDRKAYIQQIDELKKLCMAQPTAKHTYILSFLK